MELSKDLGYWRAERPDEWTMDEFIRKALDLEQENAKLKAQQSNTRLGLEKMEAIINKGGMVINGYSETGINIMIVGIDDHGISKAPTLADLIGKIALMEVD